MAVCLRWPRQEQHALVDRERGVGRDEVDVVRYGRCSVRNGAHRHPRVLREQFGQEARLLGVEMLHEDEGHAGVWWQVGEEGLECLQAAG